jgi:tRNA(fMet)-specific endonuclease VapC
MATQRILVDSSLIIDYFRKEIKSKSFLYKLFQQNSTLYISTLTVYELLCGTKTAQLHKDTKKIFALFNILEFGTIEASIAADLYKQLKQKNLIVETVDILIAATALSLSFPLATLNKSHFIRFNELELVDFHTRRK